MPRGVEIALRESRNTGQFDRDGVDEVARSVGDIDATKRRLPLAASWKQSDRDG